MVWHTQCRNTIFQQREEKIVSYQKKVWFGFVCLYLYEDNFVCGRRKFGFVVFQSCCSLVLFHFYAYQIIPLIFLLEAAFQLRN